MLLIVHRVHVTLRMRARTHVAHCAPCAPCISLWSIAQACVVRFFFKCFRTRGHMSPVCVRSAFRFGYSVVGVSACMHLCAHVWFVCVCMLCVCGTVIAGNVHACLSASVRLCACACARECVRVSPMHTFLHGVRAHGVFVGVCVCACV